MRVVPSWLLPSLSAVIFTGGLLADGRFDLQLRKVELPEMGMVTRCQLLTDKGIYGFMPPFNWRIEADSTARRLSLTSPESTLITVCSLPLGENTVGLFSQASMRESLMRQYPNARILEEFECLGGGSAGRAFDVELEGNVGPRLLFRVVFVPLSGELMEFQLRARADRFQGDSIALSSLLTSFQPMPGGGGKAIEAPR